MLPPEDDADKAEDAQHIHSIVTLVFPEPDDADLVLVPCSKIPPLMVTLTEPEEDLNAEAEAKHRHSTPGY